ncbi:AMP-binding protein [Ilumatobacter nonamiensis]|uniref:AMP-binding protein n=1 Tax=Ilumatobacter nonamiensis TaxID=467093 RepID=UPI0003458DE5|nr:AMP-binding protein [Ilumatobacter nonamiensis]
MERSLGELARRRAEDRAQQTAFVSGENSMSYHDLDRLSDELAAQLESHGLSAGDRVGYLGRNRLMYPVVAVAASKVGAISVGVNWRLAAHELAAVIQDCSPHTLYTDDEFLATAQAALQLTQTADLPALATIDADPAHTLARLAEANGAPPEAAHNMFVDRAARLDDLASLTYTSGTTGLPKGVMTSNGALIEHLDVEMDWTLDDTAVAMIVSPVFHAVGSVWTAMTIHGGATGVLVPDPDPVAILDAIEQQRVTHTLFVPALLQILLDHPDRPGRDLSALKVLVYGASPISEKLLERTKEILPWVDLVQGYGMTETTGPVTFLRPSEHISGSPLLRTAGRAAPNCEIRVFDLSTSAPAEPGMPGEVMTRSTQLCDGYWNNEAATEDLFDDDGWLHTGDIGILDANGYLTLTDRVKDVIISGGENVYSGEVERVLLAIDGVTEACVVGVPDDKWGETVMAVLVAADPPDLADVVEFCRERLAHYKCPRHVAFVDTLPKNPSGKIMRRLVRDQFSDES